jgi:enoyl-CoA hydratase
MIDYSDLKSVEVSTDNQVATVRIVPYGATVESRDRHWELGELFSRLRGDNQIRIVVLTGRDDVFLTPPARSAPGSTSGYTDPQTSWQIFTGLVRCHETMALMEKPVVAKVNGDAIGFGANLVFASDLIIAEKNVRVADHHLGMNDVPGTEVPFGVVPGDGGLARMPMIMSPARAKEYLMLARVYTGAELADIGAINYAVERDELDARVDKMVADLLRRPAYSLAWTKRLANKSILTHLHSVLDAGVAYEMVDFFHLEKMNGKIIDRLE